jgi:hypothetical protein
LSRSTLHEDREAVGCVLAAIAHEGVVGVLALRIVADADVARRVLLKL